MSLKFALYDYLGRAKRFFTVTQDTIPGDASTAKKQIGHFIFIADASGSMYGDMDALKASIEKVLTLQEYRDAEVSATLLSFSSSGDLVTHFSHVKIADILAPGSRHVEEIRKLRTRGLTCMSQGLAAVPALVKPDELTAVVLLSDGYANDRSPGAEKREIDVFVDRISKMSNVFVNTIALRDWADYKLLAYIANACSGSCFKVPSAREVFDVVHATTDLLVGSTVPAIDLPIGTGSYQVFASVSARKVIGSGSDITVRGLSSSDDRTVYRYVEVEEGTYNATNVPDAPVSAILAFASAKLAEGEINTAKYALVSTRDQTLLGDHARALVNTEIAAMAADIQTCLFDGIPAAHVMSKTFGLPNADQPSVLGILAILSENARDVTVDLNGLKTGYKRRGVRKIAGDRQPDGSIVKPHVKTAYRGSPDWANVSSFDLNRNNATVNMLVTREIDLVDASTETVIGEVAGIKLDLKSYNNYTIVGDGMLNLPRLRVKLGSKRLFRRLADVGAVSGDYDPSAVYDIVFEGRPLVAYDTTFNPNVLDGVFTRLARAKTLASILTASLKGESDRYTPEQVAALKSVYLSPALYLSLPSTNEYADKDAALADGTLDTRLSYKVDFGTADIINLGDLYSANAFLERHFTVTTDAGEEKKPKWDMRWGNKFEVGYKTLSAKTKIGPVDNLMKPIFEDALGLRHTGDVVRILTDLGVTETAPEKVLDALLGNLSHEEEVEVLMDAKRAVNDAIEDVYVKTVSPLVFFVGATGLMPDEFEAKALTADQVKDKYPNLSPGKDAADGVFYEVGNGTLVSVFTKAEVFSTGKNPLPDAEEVAA
jgi:Mg-chelatase subunit ChlD